MVELTKDGKIIKVPASSYKNFFKSQGWVITDGVEKQSTPTPVTAKKKVEPIVEEEIEVDVDDSSDEDWDEVLADEDVEKPLSEMNKKELLDKAASLGMDVSDQLTNKQLREAIKSFGK